MGTVIMIAAECDRGHTGDRTGTSMSAMAMFRQSAGAARLFDCWWPGVQGSHEPLGWLLRRKLTLRRNALFSRSTELSAT